MRSKRHPSLCHGHASGQRTAVSGRCLANRERRSARRLSGAFSCNAVIYTHAHTRRCHHAMLAICSTQPWCSTCPKPRCSIESFWIRCLDIHCNSLWRLSTGSIKKTTCEQNAFYISRKDLIFCRCLPRILNSADIMKCTECISLRAIKRVDESFIFDWFTPKRGEQRMTKHAGRFIRNKWRQ